jgi:methylase of polypeptide subunit release factors
MKKATLRHSALSVILYGVGIAYVLVTLACAALALTHSDPTTTATATTLQHRFSHARKVRMTQGHAAAVPLYRSLLLNATDWTVASRMAANEQTPDYQARVFHNMTWEQAQCLRHMFVTHQFTHANVATLMGVQGAGHPLVHAICPIYVIAAAAGTTTALNVTSALHCLCALFLLGLCVPRDALVQHVSLSSVQLLQSIGLLQPCSMDRTILIPYVQIFPVHLSSDQHIWIATDWHPRVLSTMHVGQNEQAVMYLGPDSMALISHWLLHPASCDNVNDNNKEWLLDVCTGSGIHAIAALCLDRAQHAVCVDVNPRALRFAHCNAMINAIGTDRLTLVLGNLLTNQGRRWQPPTPTPTATNHNCPTTREPLTKDSHLVDLLRHLPPSQSYRLVTANPPFLPVPPALAVSSRHGLFSAGGPTGEDVLARIVTLSSLVLAQDGILAVVSEFFLASAASFPDDERDTDKKRSDSSNNNDVALTRRLQLWWNEQQQHQHSSRSGRMLLLTNECPISASDYAYRRADTDDEYTTWLEHLQSMDIAEASPGLLLVQAINTTRTMNHSIVVYHERVPRSSWGSIWSPSNPAAVAFTSAAVHKFLSSTTAKSA